MSDDRASLADRLRLLLITDRHAARGALVGAVRSACRGGVTAVMLRERDLATPDLVRIGTEIRDVCRDEGVTFLVNHDLEAALELEAEGVHLGYRSRTVAVARATLPGDSLIGRSTHDDDELDDALAAGADYVTFGPIHDTPSKRGLLKPRGVVGLRRAVQRAGAMPIVALGGLGPGDAADVRRAGAAGMAAIRSLVAGADPETSAREHRRAWSASS